MVDQNLKALLHLFIYSFIYLFIDLKAIKIVKTLSKVCKFWIFYFLQVW